ncbi:MAG: ABC transporter permease [Vicinamibacterales bacterium]
MLTQPTLGSVTALSLREAVRAFTRQKSVFAVAVLTLALGLGLCTAMFCVVYGVILRPLSYGDPDRLVMAWAGYEGGASERDMFGEEALRQWRGTARAFDGVAGFRFATFTLLQRGEPASVEGAVVSPELFSVLTVPPEVGTVFGPELALAQGGKVALISYSLWRQRFGADPDVAGKPINLDGQIYTVTGVLPDDFDVPTQNTAVWVPLPPSSTNPSARARTLYVIGRLRPAVSLAEAQADADLVARHIATEHPDTHRGMRIHLVPFFEELVDDSRQAVVVAGAAAFLTLLICCANVSNLLLVRAIARRTEFATRLAIGAARKHLLSVVLIEGALLAVCGGIIGAGLTGWLIEALVRLSPVELPRAAAIGRGLQIPVAAGALIVVAALLVSIPAAWEVARSRLALNAVMGARATSRRFARQVIVALEIAIALTLVAGSGLMARTILALSTANPGWNTDRLHVATVVLPRNRYREPRQIRQFFETFLERLRAKPGVVSVAASSSVPATPIGFDVDLPIQVPGQETGNTGQAALRIVTPGLFRTLGIPVLEGRDLDELDGTPGLRRLVVNQSFVNRHLAGSPSVLGRQVVVGIFGPPQTYDIVGVVGDVRHYGMLHDAKPEFYVPFNSRPFFGMGVVVRTTGDPAAIAPVFRKELWALDPELPVASAASMDAIVKDTWKDRAVLTILLVSFTAIVVVMTIVGIFSVVRFSVSRQVRDIAIHLAVGARGDDVVRLVMGQSARPVAAGVVLGLVGAWMLGRGLASLIYGVSSSDPRVLLIGTTGVILVAALAAYLPSRRAATLDPVVALRVE